MKPETIDTTKSGLPLAATPLFAPSKRQTGRTTRMIEHARALAGQGKAVYIIAVNDHDAGRIRRLVGVPNRGIKVETEESLPNFDWRTMQLKRAWPNCVVLVDHYAIEARITAQVEMMTRYDLGANVTAQTPPNSGTKNHG